MPLLSRPAARSASNGPEHLAETCREEDCPRFPCRVYKEGYRRGWDEGYAEGYREGYVAGYEAGYLAGFAAGAASAGG